MKMKKILIKSDVAGVVNEICFSKGDIVKKGESLLFIESMKMEIPVLASDDGTIAEIMVEEEEAVAEGQVVIVIDA